MRKNYIDNLRTICILMLFPYHTCMMYNNFGESFYVYNKPVELLSNFVAINSTWYMPLLFVLAGISSRLAFSKRTAKEFAKERVFKLLIPLIFGILLLVPAQTYFAEKYHNNYKGGYFEQYILFFTKKTNLTGYSGGFTPGQLWFLLYLFVISMLALPIMIKFNKSEKKLDVSKISLFKIILMFILPLLTAVILEIGGKSLGEYFALFMLGFFALSNDSVIDRLEKNKWWLTGFAVILLATRWIMAEYFLNKVGLFFDIHQRLAMWVCVLAFIGMGKKYLNFSNKLTQYFAKGSFPIYVFHQSILVAVGYYVFKLTSVISLQVVMIIAISFILTVVVYEIAKRIPLTRFMFGIKK